MIAVIFEVSAIWEGKAEYLQLELTTGLHRFSEARQRAPADSIAAIEWVGLC
ncbi:hypothetical protein [Marinobacterium jannaschii]|uniref:hypothetical protein n=1 Tax=Marinobacterium jannaschii TaxID=64970 RepID=UPI000A57F9B3|nr:hypothetical protein [Marinobacterium jannaschii]